MIYFFITTTGEFFYSDNTYYNKNNEISQTGKVIRQHKNGSWIIYNHYCYIDVSLVVECFVC